MCRLYNYLVVHIFILFVTRFKLHKTIFFFLVYPDYKDFDNTTLIAKFPVDEGLDPVTSVELTICIVDDEIDEADEQVFIILLEVINATNIDKVNIVDRKTSIGRIKDDESKYVELINCNFV